MVVDRRKPTIGAMAPVEGKESLNDSVVILDDLCTESEVAKLRGRWELASVLNFLIKKERALNRKKRQEMLLTSLRSSSDEYDRAIDEAIEVTKKRKTVEEENQGQKLPTQTIAINGGSDAEGSVSKDSSDWKANSVGSDTEYDKLQEAGNDGNKKEDENADYSSGTDGDDNNVSDSGNSADENEKLNNENHKKHMSMGSRRSNRLARVDIHPAGRTGNLGTKNRSRQRPVVNSALEIIVPDSEDDTSSDHTM
ncbi:hypothetical protein V6N13_118994 [Hibiscus sabdariffa]